MWSYIEYNNKCFIFEVNASSIWPYTLTKKLLGSEEGPLVGLVVGQEVGMVLGAVEG